MNTMADGAAQRLVAQIGEALFGQPGLDLSEIANSLRIARGSGSPLLCATCYGVGMIGAPSFYAPDEGGDPCPDCAQPSPAGQGDARAQFEAWAHAQSYRGGNIITDRAADYPDVYAFPNAQLTWQCWKAALAARQPVGQEPVAWMTHHAEPMLFPTREEASDYCDDDERPIPLYAATPAQAVDLGQFRDLARSWIVEAGGAVADTKHACADELLALIDSKAVGNG